MASASSISSTTFSGNSSYAADLQNAISRAVGFASLPIQLLQNHQNDATNQQMALQSLSSKFQALQTSLDALNSSASGSSYAVTLDNPSVGTASTSSSVVAGNYSLYVSKLGSQTNTMSANGLTTVTNPSSGNIDSATGYTLTVDGQTFQISNTSGSLNDLANAINVSGANVQATVVNIGGNLSPDYRLSVQGTKYAATSIQLSDGSNNSLLTTLVPGSNVTYQVNGQSSTATSDSRSIALAPGLTVNVVGTGTTNINVAQSTSGISNALTSFVTAYNAAVDELNKSRGQNGGALSGNSVIYTLQSNLNQLINSGVPTGSISSVANLGLTFDQNGHLSFDSSVFHAAVSSSTNDVMTFLGAESGGGFLQAANSILTGIDDITTGLLPQATQLVTSQISALATQISDKQASVALLQKTLTAQMSKADATISGLQQQATYYTNLFATMRANNSSGNG
jgi:flagellar hook-associated protein 2